MRRREGNRPDRRVADKASLAQSQLLSLVDRAIYEGSASHKLHPGDYGFTPSVNPHPAKSVCDDLRAVALKEAKELLACGIARGMVSKFDAEGAPKYVWAVDQNGEVYEAKTKPPQAVYHGYRLGNDEKQMRRYVLDEWISRCPKI